MNSQILNNKLEGVLETLEEEPLTDEETQQALQDKINEFNTSSFDYKDIEFDSEDDMSEDMKLSRKIIMDTIDKSKKISDMVFENLLVDPTNIAFLQLAQESNKTIQTSIKALNDLHNTYHKIKNQKKRNDILDGVEKPKDEDKEDGFEFGSVSETKKES